MNTRISLLTALVDLAFLGVLIAVGMYAGAAAGHQIGVGKILLEYGGVSTLVGLDSLTGSYVRRCFGLLIQVGLLSRSSFPYCSDISYFQAS